MPDDVLAARVAQPDVTAMPDWQVAAILNAPDPSLPEIVDRINAPCGFGTVLDALGPIDGATFLDELTAMSSTMPPIKWALRVMEMGNLDLSLDSVRAQLDWLVSINKLTASQALTLKERGEMRRHPSWAEYHGIKVDARQVGLVRGGK